MPEHSHTDNSPHQEGVMHGPYIYDGPVENPTVDHMKLHQLNMHEKAVERAFRNHAISPSSFVILERENDKVYRETLDNIHKAKSAETE